MAYSDGAAGGAAGGAASGAAVGMALGPYGALAGGVIGGTLGLIGGAAAARAKERQVQEALRRMKLHNDQVLGDAASVAASSGFTSDSRSLTTYLSDMTAEMRRQMDWTAKTGQADANMTQKAATYGAMSDIAGALFKFGAESNWGKEPQVK